MIAVTEEAKQYVRTVGISVGLPEGLVFRLDDTRTGWYGERRLAVGVEEPREGDQRVEHEGENLLHISGAVSAAYDGCVLDLEGTPEGAAFILMGSPNAQSSIQSWGSCPPGSPE